MILTKEQVKSFEEASRPLIKWLNENCNPHTTVIVDSTSSEVLSSSARVICEEFLKD